MKHTVKARIGSLLLALAMLLTLLPATVLAAEPTFTDTQGHWAESAIDRWTSYSVI